MFGFSFASQLATAITVVAGDGGVVFSVIFGSLTAHTLVSVAIYQREPFNSDGLKRHKYNRNMMELRRDESHMEPTVKNNNNSRNRGNVTLHKSTIAYLAATYNSSSSNNSNNKSENAILSSDVRALSLNVTALEIFQSVACSHKLASNCYSSSHSHNFG